MNQEKQGIAIVVEGKRYIWSIPAEEIEKVQTGSQVVFIPHPLYLTYFWSRERKKKIVMTSISRMSKTLSDELTVFRDVLNMKGPK